MWFCGDGMSVTGGRIGVAESSFGRANCICDAAGECFIGDIPASEETVVDEGVELEVGTV